MPLNPRTFKARSTPVRAGRIDRHYRCPLPPEIDWSVGVRVYFSLTKEGSGDGPPGIVVRRKPGPVREGRLLSTRVRRIGFTPRARLRWKPAHAQP